MNTVSASSILLASAQMMAAAIQSDLEVIEDLMGLQRDMIKGTTGASHRQARINAITDLAMEMAERIESEWSGRHKI